MDKNEMHLLAKAVIRSVETGEIPTELPSVAASPSSSLALINAIVDEMKLRKGSIEDGLDATMELLEELYEIKGESSLFLMASLRTIAGSVTGFYDVGDSIGLWIQNNLSPRLRSYLLELGREIKDENISSHITQWAKFQKE